LEESFRESALYKEKLESSNEEDAELYLREEVNDFIKSNRDLMSTTSNQVRSAFVNKVLRRSVSRKFVTKSASVFANVNPLRLPHVMSAYRSMLQFQRILEDSFYIYNPTVKNFIVGLMEELRIFTAFDALEKVDLVSKELLKFVTSNLEFELNGEMFSTAVVTSTSTVNGKSVDGKEAWKQNFTNKLVQANKLDIDNELLNSLEFREVNGSTLVGIVADKTSDEEVLEKIRESFLELAKSDLEVSPGYKLKDLAKELFKYSLISEGMFYDKTGFSLVFPTE